MFPPNCHRQQSTTMNERDRCRSSSMLCREHSSSMFWSPSRRTTWSERVRDQPWTMGLRPGIAGTVEHRFLSKSLCVYDLPRTLSILCREVSVHAHISCSFVSFRLPLCVIRVIRAMSFAYGACGRLRAYDLPYLITTRLSVCGPTSNSRRNYLEYDGLLSNHVEVTSGIPTQGRVIKSTPAKTNDISNTSQNSMSPTAHRC